MRAQPLCRWGMWGCAALLQFSVRLDLPRPVALLKRMSAPPPLLSQKGPGAPTPAPAGGPPPPLSQAGLAPGPPPTLSAAAVVAPPAAGGPPPPLSQAGGPPPPVSSAGSSSRSIPQVSSTVGYQAPIDIGAQAQAAPKRGGPVSAELTAAVKSADTGPAGVRNLGEEAIRQVCQRSFVPLKCVALTFWATCPCVSRSRSSSPSSSRPRSRYTTTTPAARAKSTNAHAIPAMQRRR